MSRLLMPALAGLVLGGCGGGPDLAGEWSMRQGDDCSAEGVRPQTFIVIERLEEADRPTFVAHLPWVKAAQDSPLPETSGEASPDEQGDIRFKFVNTEFSGAMAMLSMMGGKVRMELALEPEGGDRLWLTEWTFNMDVLDNPSLGQSADALDPDDEQFGDEFARYRGQRGLCLERSET